MSGCRRRGRRASQQAAIAASRSAGRQGARSTRPTSAADSAGAAKPTSSPTPWRRRRPSASRSKSSGRAKTTCSTTIYRPVTYVRMWGAVDAAGKPVAFMQRIVQQSLMKRIGALPPNGVDFISVDGAATLPYDIPNIRVEYTETDPGIPFGFWRSVGASVNGFVVEAFIDELATAAGKDPYQFRRDLLGKASAPSGRARSRRRESRLGQAAAAGPRPRHRRDGSVRQHRRAGRGSFGRRNGNVRVHKIWCAVDTGWVINPDTIKAQMEGGTVYGLTAALKGEITIQNGRVMQRHFNDYPDDAAQRDAGDRGLHRAEHRGRRAASASRARRSRPVRSSTRSPPRPASASTAADPRGPTARQPDRPRVSPCRGQVLNPHISHDLTPAAVRSCRLRGILRPDPNGRRAATIVKPLEGACRNGVNGRNLVAITEFSGPPCPACGASTSRPNVGRDRNVRRSSRFFAAPLPAESGTGKSVIPRSTTGTMGVLSSVLVDSNHDSPVRCARF